jgi:hypothetical protein
MSGDRPALELEVTEEMIEAATLELAGWNPDWETTRSRAERVLRSAFKAMETP